MTEKVLLTWSGGKDSALTLYDLQKDHKYKILALLTTVTEDYHQISMHGVRSILLEQQTEFIGLPIEKIYINKNSSNEEYEAKMKAILQHYQNQGVSSVVFGDIFLEDIRNYREQNLSKIGMKGIFPLWKRDTTELAHLFIDLGFRAVIACVDSHALDKKFVGRDYDGHFLSELPPTVDPCGENGEFHSFVFDGPPFQQKVSFKKGEIILRDNHFYFCDLLPTQE